MNNIGENLKILRQTKGLTQEQVAERIHLTRQAISNYESGKNQPGVDVLQDLARVYGVGVEDIIYGGDKQIRIRRTVKTMAAADAIIFASLELIKGVCLSLSHTVYAIQSGAVPPELYVRLEIHNKLVGIGYGTERVTIIVPLLFLCMAIVCAFTARPVSWKSKAAYFLCLSAAVTAMDLVFSLIDPEYPFSSYYLNTAVKLAVCAVLTLISIVIDCVRARRGVVL